MLKHYENVDISEFVDYATEFGQYVKNIKRGSGSEWTGLCPFHNDHHASFSVNIKNGTYYCHACEAKGNLITLISEKEGIDKKEAYKQILMRYGRWQDNPKPSKEKIKSKSNYKSCSLEDYSNKTMIPIDDLREYGCREEQRDGVKNIMIPYFRTADDFTHNRVQRFRRRYGGKDKIWNRVKKNSSGTEIIPYGIWKLVEFTEDYLILVEGESDAQTLWYLGLPAIGIPGAKMMRDSWVPMLRPDQDGKSRVKRIFLHKEPDQGGDMFVAKCAEIFVNAKADVELQVFSCSTIDSYKDPSDFYVGMTKAGKSCEEVRAAFLGLLDQAKPVEKDPNILHFPIKCRIPDKYVISRDGVYVIGENSGSERISGTPVLISAVIENLDDSSKNRQQLVETKYEIIAFIRGQWRSMLVDAESILVANTMAKVFASKGINVTSNSAKQLVGYMSELLRLNEAILPVKSMVDQLGWHGKSFVAADTIFSADTGQLKEKNIILNLDAATCRRALAYHENGSFDVWNKWMNRIVAKSDTFRFLLAASFASPLLQLLNVRSFIIYAKGMSGDGKSAATFAALSAWGEFEKIKTDFNSTKNALGAMASIFSGFPMVIDELEHLAGRRDAGEVTRQLVYVLAGEQERGRSTKDGGIRESRTYRQIFLASGERDIIPPSAAEGMSNRVLQIESRSLFYENDASETYAVISEHYGHAGYRWIRWIVETASSQSGIDALKSMYAEMLENLKAYAASSYLSGDERSDHHIRDIAVVMAADVMARKAVLDPYASLDRLKSDSIRMGRLILDQQASKKEFDLNRKILEELVGWVYESIQHFEEKADPCYGSVTFGKDPSTETIRKVPMHGTLSNKQVDAPTASIQIDEVLIYTGSFDSFLKRFDRIGSKKNFLAYMKTHGIIRCDAGRTTNSRRVYKNKTKVIAFDISAAEKMLQGPAEDQLPVENIHIPSNTESVDRVDCLPFI